MVDRCFPLCLHFSYLSKEFHDTVTEESYEASCVVGVCCVVGGMLSCGGLTVAGLRTIVGG